MKSQKIFIKKRNRLIQNGWRDGILGVELPGDEEASYFYTPELLRQEERRAQKVAIRNNCKIIGFKRFIDLQEKAGESEEIEVAMNERTARKDPKVVEMHHGWTSKKLSENRFRDTHHQVFGGTNYNWNAIRAQHLM
jgi:hypothetical protein